MLYRRYAMQSSIISYSEAPVTNLLCLECTNKDCLPLLILQFKTMGMNDILASMNRHEEYKHINKRSLAVAK